MMRPMSSELATLSPDAGAAMPRPGRRREAAAKGALLLPLSLIFLAGFVVPLFAIIRFSLDTFNGLSGVSSALVFQQYQQVLLSGFYDSVWLHTIAIAAIVTGIDLVLSYPMSLAIARGPRAFRGVVMVITVLPLLVSVVVRSFGWQILLSSSGPVPHLIAVVSGQRVTLLYNTAGVVIGMAQLFLPFVVFSLVGPISSVDRSIEEAATALGARPFRVFLTVTLPLSIEGALQGSMFAFVLALSAFVTPELLGGGKVPVLASVIYDQATGPLNWPVAAAAGTLLLVATTVCLALYSVSVRLLTKRLGLAVRSGRAGAA